MPNNITAPRVPLTDPRTGLIHREWYRFFFSLYDLVLSGNTTSITDLMVGPEGGAQLAQLVALTKAFQATQVEPPPPDTLGLIKALQGLGVASQQVDLSVVTKALQALQLAPVPVPTTPPMVVVATLNFPNTVAGACSDLTVTVPGAVSGDVVALGVPAASVPANGSYSAWVSAADTVTVRYANNDLVVAYDPASGDFRVAVTRY